MTLKPPRLQSSPTTAVAVAPSLQDALTVAHLQKKPGTVDRRTVLLAMLAAVLGVLAAGVALGLVNLINLVTNLAYFGLWSSKVASPATSHLGILAIFVPVIGGLVVGVMARFGSQAIRGHGIPEAMEQILVNQSRIPARITFLKPISAAISIGTGGPFGAEGPIIATGGALGSVLGQCLNMSANERKSLLAAGAAAGMTAIFGSPLAAVLLAVELLLFEFKPRSLLPVVMAAVAAGCSRRILFGDALAFPMTMVAPAAPAAMLCYIVLGCALGLVAILISRSVYAIEDGFEKLPIHWMWWPALGGIAVGVIGYVSPKTLGVGYDNIQEILDGHFVGSALLVFAALKFCSWAIALGSGTSGGTLAPLLTIGGALGALLGSVVAEAYPSIGVDPRVAALVGMAALFAGASRAMLTSVIFAWETTGQSNGLLPLLCGVGSAYLVASLLQRTSIMTEKIVRRGVAVPDEYGFDPLAALMVDDFLKSDVVTWRSDQTLAEVRRYLTSSEPRYQHQGFPIVDHDAHVVGVLTRRDLLNSKSSPGTELQALIVNQPFVIRLGATLRDAVDLMVITTVGRLPILTNEQPGRLCGIITRSDLLAAHGPSLQDKHLRKRSFRPKPNPRTTSP